MNPYQRLAAFDSPSSFAAWKRTAPLLRRWAKTARGERLQQAEAICAHLIRVWCRPVLALVPELAPHAVAIRSAPCAADWIETLRLANTAKDAGLDYFLLGSSVDSVLEASLEAARNAAHNAIRYAAYSAFRGIVDDLVYNAARDAASAAVYASAGRGLRGRPNADAFNHATEEWILLAEPDALAVLPGEIRAALDTEPDAYAVAWDWLAARGDAAGGTDDGARLRDGTDASGAPVPTWARRTALVRCALRLEMPR